MTVRAEIDAYFAAQPAPKRAELLALHRAIVAAVPRQKLWFLDGKNDAGKQVSNPNVGYGDHTMKLAGGKTREFYRVGLSANSTGISVYVMGLRDKAHLKKTYGKTLGKATVTGYCIKFRSLADVDLDVLLAAVREGLTAPR